MLHAPLVTIAICTLDRSSTIALCQTLLQQRGENPAFEIVVANNGPSEEIATEVACLQGVRYLYDPEPGLSRARNAAVSAAAGDYVLFLDDDATPREGYLRAVESILRAHSPDILGGPIEPVFECSPPRWLPISYVRREKVKASGWVAAGGVSGGNFAVRRAVFERLGGFREELGMVGGALGFLEEFEFVLRYRRDPDRAFPGIYYSQELRVGHRTPADKTTLRYLMARNAKSHRQKAVLFRSLAANDGRRLAMRLASACALAVSLLAGLVRLPATAAKGGLRRAGATLGLELAGRIGFFIGAWSGSIPANSEPAPTDMRSTKRVAAAESRSIKELHAAEDLMRFAAISFERRPPGSVLWALALNNPMIRVEVPEGGFAGHAARLLGLAERPSATGPYD